ncbi:MAG: hypothetical protein KI790_11690 [Cyclobacteriaceae bacterium]|nr:hypothetical protein [Cyclobacteriaceae bacterium HetDA_MAG_MS6]
MDTNLMNQKSSKRLSVSKVVLLIIGLQLLPLVLLAFAKNENTRDLEEGAIWIIIFLVTFQQISAAIIAFKRRFGHLSRHKWDRSSLPDAEDQKQKPIRRKAAVA